MTYIFYLETVTQKEKYDFLLKHSLLSCWIPDANFAEVLAHLNCC